MKKTLILKDYDLVFISYDEPNAKENWDKIRYHAPYAKRVQNIKGIADGYREAGKLATTDHVITIDGDTRITSELLTTEFTINTDTDNYMCSWDSLNSVNGLKYENGGVKFWPTDLVSNLATHEHCPPENIPGQIDYQGGLFKQIHMPPLYVNEFTSVTYSTTCIEGSPLQAWRSGFREGVKLGLHKGAKVDDLRQIWPGLLHMLTIWMTVGADIPNGAWSMLGARQGCYMTHFTNWDIKLVRDFDYLNKYFNDSVGHLSNFEVLSKCCRLGKIISQKFDVCDPFTSEQSRVFKRFNVNPDRMLVDQINDYDQYKKD